MGRGHSKIEALDLDVSANIRKLTNGNISKFYNEQLPHLSMAVFYEAMRGDLCAPYIIDDIEEAYRRLRSESGLSEDEVSLIPKFDEFLHNFKNEIDSAIIDPNPNYEEICKKNHKYLKFFSRALKEGLICLDRTKKSYF